MKKHNPWIGALWFCGIALIVAAFSAELWVTTFYYPAADVVSPGPVVVFLQQLADATITPALYVGFGTVAGLLFLHAKNHARGKRKPAAHG